MRILLGYAYYPYPVDVRTTVEAWLGRLRTAGFDVHGHPLTIDPPANRFSWGQLDAAWRRGDRGLMAHYERLARKLEGFDAFLNWNGINVHPEFVRQLPTFNIFGCFDDPESSDDLSKPAAAAYDLSLVGNAAEVDAYRSYGVKHARFWPLGFHAEDHDPSLTRDRILEGERDVEVALLCERVNDWRRERLDRFAEAFPKGRYHGRGWPAGFLDEKDRVPLYQRTRIGPNFHNSTGPINYRTYALPANGVMLLCDNKAHLGKVFVPGVEAVGFDTTAEAVELCRHYLADDRERRRIAAAGWERAVRDYNEVSVFRLVETYAREAGYPGRQAPRPGLPPEIALKRHERRTALRRFFHVRLKPPLRAIKRLILRKKGP